MKHYGLEAEVTPDIYVPIPQAPDVTSQWLANNMYRGPAGPFVVVAATLLGAGIMASIAAALPIRRIDTLEALRIE